ncbi:hypothetical protein DPEC_G00015520 [Dallia pectoralis]|uniref:Uncharacterized protein n=1 Tax=Dallia pectoralis TaxID=75939 RepID=A0ACC2HMG2_DALPE|nr:hypothetical protein DPEC_G00015520 [Dallia pectoralis]
MASLRVVSLLASRLGRLPTCPVITEMSYTWSLLVSAKRNSSRHANRTWTGQNHSQVGRTSTHGKDVSRGTFEDEDPDMEDDKIQALLSEERRRQRKLKYHIIKRQMTEPGAPERRLTWETMEQIRYLKQELPEEWTVDRLAEGFSVHRDVVLRVLRSKFTPTPERRAKQDASVWARLRQQALNGDRATGGNGRQLLPGGGGTAGKDMQLALPGGGGTAGKDMQLALPGGGGTAGKDMQLALPGGGGEKAGAQGRLQVNGPGPRSNAPAMLPTGSDIGALISLSGQSLTPREDPSQHYMSPAWHSRHVSIQRRPQEEEKSAAEHCMLEIPEEDWTEEELWDGKVFSEDELEELMVSMKASSVVQKGAEFFDDDGNFLYRI